MLETQMNDWQLPTFDNRESRFENGRNVFEGWQRACGLNFGSVRDKVLADPLYQHALEHTQGSVMSEWNRLNLFLIIKLFLGKLESQNIVEFGAYRGGSVLFMATLLKELYPDSKVLAFDTFEGMPETDPSIDLHNEGDFIDADLSELIDYADRHSLTNLRFVKGRFENTLDEAAGKLGQVGLAHIDCDIYSSVAYCQEAILPYLVPRAYIVYDDACVSSCIGATQAVEEFIIRHKHHSEQIWPHFVFRKPEI